MEPGRCHLQTLAKSIQAADREPQAESEAMSSHVWGYLFLNRSIWAQAEKTEENH